jgi:hypothetical protein
LNTLNIFEMNNPDDDHQRAVAQAARHATNLAMARWSSGITYDQMQLAQALRPSSQARWYEQADANFRRWREDGGFADQAADDEAGIAQAPNPAAAPDQRLRPVTVCVSFQRFASSLCNSACPQRGACEHH